MKKIISLAFISLVIAAALLFFNNVVKTTWADKLYEVGTVALLIFIFLLIGFVVAKALGKTAMAIKNKTSRKGGRL